MKSVGCIMCLMCLMCATCGANESDEQYKQFQSHLETTNNMGFILFYGDGCEPCKRMAAELVGLRKFMEDSDISVLHIRSDAKVYGQFAKIVGKGQVVPLYCLTKRGGKTMYGADVGYRSNRELVDWMHKLVK